MADRFTPEFTEKVNRFYARAAEMVRDMGLPQGSYEIHQGQGGYDGTPVIMCDDGPRYPIVKAQDNGGTAYRVDDSHPRRAEVMAWLRENDVRWSDFLTSIKGQAARKPLSAKQIDAVARSIDSINARNVERAAKVENTVKRERITEDGIYRMDGEIFKVQRAVHGSGNLYAKRLIVNGYGSADFEYAPGIVSRLTADMRLSLADAQEFGRLYGVCCQCGRTLTDEKSIANGIGPICAGKI